MTMTPIIKELLYSRYPKKEGWVFSVERKYRVGSNVYNIMLLKAPYRFARLDQALKIGTHDWLGRVTFNKYTFEEITKHIREIEYKKNIILNLFQGCPKTGRRFEEHGTLKDKIKLM